MAKEIERKFLVKDRTYASLAKGILYKQGYLSDKHERIVRIRVIEDKAFITIKGKVVGCTRLEFEYEIPLKDADEIIENLCIKPIIEKHRYKFDYLGSIWEIDEFHGDNEGLIIAEVELKDEREKFEKPDWIGEEVTGDMKYNNSNLIGNPYKNWVKK